MQSGGARGLELRTAALEHLQCDVSVIMHSFWLVFTERYSTVRNYVRFHCPADDCRWLWCLCSD